MLRLIFFAHIGQSVSLLGTAMTGFAISIWAFERTGSALVLSVSAMLVMLPRMLMGIFISPFVDRNNKKRIMICADIGTGICTFILFLLLWFDTLAIWHIFIINAVTSVLGSFQTLASSVTVSAIIPKKHYVRATGLQSLTGGIVQVIAPALAAVLLGLVGITGILIFDLITMALACLSLAAFVKIPAEYAENKSKRFNARNYFNDLRDGFKAVKASILLYRLMLFMTVLNFITSMASYGLLAPMVLAKSGNNEVSLAVVSSAVGLGGMAGALLVLIVPTRTNKVRMIFLCYLLSIIFGDILFSFGNSLTFWVITGFLGAAFVPAITANATYLWRTIIPIELQGRAFAVRYAIQSSAIPIGVLAGGLLADFVFEPFMEQPPPLLGRFFGEGSGSGMALMFFISGLVCVALSIAFMLNRSMQQAETNTTPLHNL